MSSEVETSLTDQECALAASNNKGFLDSARNDNGSEVSQDRHAKHFPAQQPPRYEFCLKPMIEKYLSPPKDADVVKGLVAGIAGGLLASLVMEQFQFLWSKVSEAIARARNEEQQAKRKGRKGDPANVKAAQSISKSVFGRRLPKSKKRLAGEAVHYAMGTTSAAIYGALAEASPITTLGDGVLFGTAVWLLADEISVPALRLSKSPTKIPVSTHVYALVSHLVYGWTTEMVRRAVRKAL